MAGVKRPLKAMAKAAYRRLPGMALVRGRLALLLNRRCPPVGLCGGCRRFDSAEALRQLVLLVREALENAGLAYVEYAAGTSAYEFFVPEDSQEALAVATASLQAKRLRVIRSRIELSLNKYEVDPAAVAVPLATAAWTVSHAGGCRKAARLLARWSVRLSFFSDSKKARLFHLRNDLVRVLPPAQPLPATLEDLWRAARKDASGADVLPMERVNFPVDLVYTWVDGADPQWRAKRANFLPTDEGTAGAAPARSPLSAANEARYRNRDELRYSLRSIHMYAPFVRKIFLVTDDQVPAWLDTAGGKIEVVSHKALFDRDTVYPAFSSRPIEFNLHRIEGLAEHFVYMNDDFFLCAPVAATDFFVSNGVAKVFPTDRRLDARAVQEGDRATVASHKNAAAAFERHLGVSPTGKFLHAPYPVRRSACLEIDRVFRDELRIAKGNRFRSWDDVSWSFVTPNYMLHKGYAVPGTIESRYIDVHHEALPEKLMVDGARFGVQALCINDTDGEGEAPYEGFMKQWLEARFPVVAPWERVS